MSVCTRLISHTCQLKTKEYFSQLKYIAQEYRDPDVQQAFAGRLNADLKEAGMGTISDELGMWLLQKESRCSRREAMRKLFCTMLLLCEPTRQPGFEHGADWKSKFTSLQPFDAEAGMRLLDVLSTSLNSTCSFTDNHHRTTFRGQLKNSCTNARRCRLTRFVSEISQKRNFDACSTRSRP